MIFQLKKVPKNDPQLTQPTRGVSSKTLNPRWLEQQGRKLAAAQAEMQKVEAAAIQATDPEIAAQTMAAANALAANAAEVAKNDTTAAVAPEGTVFE
jgi:hypothetical protein